MSDLQLHDISDAVAFKLKVLEIKSLTDISEAWDKFQAELTDLRLSRVGEGKNPNDYDVSVTTKFDKGKLVLVPWTFNMIFAQVGTAKHDAYQREAHQLKGAVVKLDGGGSFDAFLAKPKMVVCDPNWEVTSDPEKQQFIIPFWLVATAGTTKDGSEGNMALATINTKSGFTLPVLKNNRTVQAGDTLRFYDEKKRTLATVVEDAAAVDSKKPVNAAPVNAARGRGSKRARGGGRG